MAYTKREQDKSQAEFEAAWNETDDASKPVKKEKGDTLAFMSIARAPVRIPASPHRERKAEKEPQTLEEQMTQDAIEDRDYLDDGSVGNAVNRFFSPRKAERAELRKSENKLKASGGKR